MSAAGDADLLVRARSTLLDALDALVEQRDALVLIGAQAVYLRSGSAISAVAESTKDSELAVDPRLLDDTPLLDEAMSKAGFYRDLVDPQPGAWLSRDGVPVDLMVPEALAGPPSRRGARIPPHSNQATRRTAGLEAAVVDHSNMKVGALVPEDERSYELKVAGTAALLVAKLHKIGERQADQGRLADKDAHDVYRLLVSAEAATIAGTLAQLQGDELAGATTVQAISFLDELFASGSDALGAVMAGRAEELVGDPEVVRASVSVLARDVVSALS